MLFWAWFPFHFITQVSLPDTQTTLQTDCNCWWAQSSPDISETQTCFGNLYEPSLEVSKTRTANSAVKWFLFHSVLTIQKHYTSCFFSSLLRPQTPWRLMCFKLCFIFFTLYSYTLCPHSCAHTENGGCILKQ